MGCTALYASVYSPEIDLDPHLKSTNETEVLAIQLHPVVSGMTLHVQQGSMAMLHAEYKHMQNHDPDWGRRMRAWRGYGVVLHGDRAPGTNDSTNDSAVEPGPSH